MGKPDRFYAAVLFRAGDICGKKKGSGQPDIDEAQAHEQEGDEDGFAEEFLTDAVAEEFADAEADEDHAKGE